MTDIQPKTVELWIRSFAPCGTAGNHERAVELADRIGSRRGLTVRVEVWGDAFDRSGRAPNAPVLERIEGRLAAFEEWAAETGRRLDPFFRTRHVESTITGDARTICRLPTLAVAEYRGERLVHVTPCGHGDRTVEPIDRLETLLEDDAEDALEGEDDAPERDDALEYDDAVSRPRHVEPPKPPGETTM